MRRNAHRKKGASQSQERSYNSTPSGLAGEVCTHVISHFFPSGHETVPTGYRPLGVQPKLHRHEQRMSHAPWLCFHRDGLDPLGISSRDGGTLRCLVHPETASVQLRPSIPPTPFAFGRWALQASGGTCDACLAARCSSYLSCTRWPSTRPGRSALALA